MDFKKTWMGGTALTLILAGGAFACTGAAEAFPARPQGACDIYAAGGDPCVAAHSTTRALYASYNGPLYQVVRYSDGKTLNIGVVQPNAKDGGGYADAAAQDVFCANTSCAISIIYDQSGKHNDLKQATRARFLGPSFSGGDNLPVADMAPVSVMGHKVYGAFLLKGMGLRDNNPTGTAVDDQAEGMYWVIDGSQYMHACCFDYGNAEIDAGDDGNGTMEALYFGNSSAWFHGKLPGPWIMTDQENNLVGCVNKDSSTFCPTLPTIKWRFTTAMMKGKPHRWATMVGDARSGKLKVAFDGKRIDGTYDPMRKQGAILLGTGGDNSNAGRGVFYEGAMTAGGTYPSAATEQKVQANVVAAHYTRAAVSLVPAGQDDAFTGLQSFIPGETRTSTLTFTNTSGKTLHHVALGISVPKGWKVMAEGGHHGAKVLARVAPGARVPVNFRITAASAAFNGQIMANASWQAGNQAAHESAVLHVRVSAPVKINELYVSDHGERSGNNFIELYNAGNKTVDLSNWSLAEHNAYLPVASSIRIPAGTKLAPHGFYLLGQADSGLAVPAAATDNQLYLRNTYGMKAGDRVVIGSGKNAETRRIVKVSGETPFRNFIWQSAEDPYVKIPVGSTNVPMDLVSGLHVGDKLALGYGISYPEIGRNTEKYQIVTVKHVGKPGTRGFVDEDAPAGSRVIQTTETKNLSVGDTIRLDIASKGHGQETVTIKHIGTAAQRGYVAKPARAGAHAITLSSTTELWGAGHVTYKVGDKVDIGTPANRQRVVLSGVKKVGNYVRVSFKTPLKADHIFGEYIIVPGTGVELTAPLKYNHAANLPYSVRGTGVDITPALKHTLISNAPVMALHASITLDKPLTKAHAIDAVVRDAAVAKVGYRGKKTPNQWFGGPALSYIGSAVLRDAQGHIADSLNYGQVANSGNLVDPYAAEGTRGVSGPESENYFKLIHNGSYYLPGMKKGLMYTSIGRFPDGHDTDHNVADFQTPAGVKLTSAAKAGARKLSVMNAADFHVGQPVRIGDGTSWETATIAAVHGDKKVLDLTAPLHAAHPVNTLVMVPAVPTPGVANHNLYSK